MGKKREHDVEDCFIAICSVCGFLYTYLFITEHKLIALVGAIFFFMLDALLIWMLYDIIKHPEDWKSAL
jgi:hypothetical protein